MGSGRICYFGFSIRYTNSFSESMEKRTADLELALRRGESFFGAGLRTLHDAVDAALAGNAAACASTMALGLGELQECNAQLTTVGRCLVESRAALFERKTVAPDDPLVARERQLAVLDYEAIHRELAAAGAVLPQRAFWDDVVGRLRRGGAWAAMRLVDRHVRELQSHVRSLIGEVESLQGLPLETLAHRLHGFSIPVATITVAFSRLNMTLVYLSILCERATFLYERERLQAEAAVAV